MYLCVKLETNDRYNSPKTYHPKQIKKRYKTNKILMKTQKKEKL